MNTNIYIPKPCHENWNTMTPDEKGRHCAVCSKVVTDFTQMKTEEIIATLQSTKEEVCGHIDITQLTPANKKQKIYFWIKGTLIPKIGYTAFALFGLAAIFKKSAFAQTQVMANGGIKYEADSQNEKQLTVVVVDEHNQPVPNATINITSEHQVIGNGPTNSKGSFIQVINEFDFTQLNIQVSAPGYKSKLISNIKLHKQQQTIQVKLDEEIIMMGKIALVENPETTEVNKDSVNIDEPISPVKTEVELFNTNPTVMRALLPVDLLENENTSANELSTPPAKDLTTKLFTSFPNPTHGDLMIVTDENDVFDIKVYNENGVLILQQTNQFKRAEISLESHAAGTYYAILLINNTTIETHKIILIK